RNLGATQVATSSTDHLAYGSLYQWGRGSDGHELITWTNFTTGTPVNGNFITINSGNFDWRSPQKDTLWQGVAGENNPCPTGYRIPTDVEWEAERLSWSTNDAAGALASPLKLPMAGLRSNNGSLFDVGTFGRYWSSTVSSTNARRLDFNSSTANMSTRNRASGLSVRCLKD
uniref:FISUMP domain-containing protein n=3 Tax=Algoriphagus sp. TaxID=1872435 RepID=UPI004047A0EC